jgi:formylmethanofuran dehydrogenase subunit C
MIAGTVLVFGDCGARPAAGMRRGTVALLGDRVPTLLGTFSKGSVAQPTYLLLTFRYLRSLGFDVPRRCSDAVYRIYHGDQLTIGRGEVLVRETAA